MSENKWQDDLMNNFVIEDDCLTEGELTEMEQKRILNKVMAEAGITPKTERAGISRRRLMLLGLVAVMTLALGSMAFAQFGISRDFLGFFNAHEQQSGVLQQTGQEVMSSVTDSGATLTVEQVVGDRQSLYVLMDFLAPEGTALDALSYDWQKANVYLSESRGMGYYFEQLPDDDPADNHIRMMLCLDTDKSLSGQELTLDLGDLRGYYPEKLDYETALSGNWKLAFTLDYTPTFKDIPQTAEIKLGEATAQVTDLEISPLSMLISVKVSNPEGYEPPDFYIEPEGGGVAMDANGNEVHYGYAESPAEVRIGDFLADLDNLTVTLTDGTVLETKGGGGNSDGDNYQSIFSFNSVLNAEDIASIVYCGEELKLQ